MKFNTSYGTKKYFFGKDNTCEYIMLHHTGKGDGKRIAEYLATGQSQKSCHYVVDIDGTIYELASPKFCTWHAGQSKYGGRENFNYYSIGIEIVSDGHTFTDNQRSAVDKLIRKLMTDYNIPSKNIIRHLDVASFRGKRDVGDNFWNKKFKTFKEYQDSFDCKNEDNLAPEAIAMRDLGIRNGLRGKDPATREEVAIMIARVLKKLSD